MILGHETSELGDDFGLGGCEIRSFTGVFLEVVEFDFQRVVVLAFAEHFLANPFPFPHPDGLLPPVT